MKLRLNKLLFFILILLPAILYSQTDPPLPEKELDVRIDRALDHFGEGDYEKAISLLENVLVIDPENERASDLLISIRELYEMETGTTGEESSLTEKPDFSINDPEIPEEDPQEEEELEKPDFSIRDEDNELIQPVQTRSRFELFLSSNLVFPWDNGEESIVFPDEGTHSVSFTADMDMYLNRWNRIIGFAGTYSLFLLDPEGGDFSDSMLHVVDGMISFRTFFREEIDSRIIFKLSAGYRGYFSNGYDFYDVERQYLNGFNMGINLEGPFIYYFWTNQFFKRFILDLDMNLLFFPEINTLNLFDFRLNGRYQFDHFAMGIHFGAYSVITTVDVEYIWMSGLNVSFSF